LKVERCKLKVVTLLSPCLFFPQSSAEWAPPWAQSRGAKLGNLSKKMGLL